MAKSYFNVPALEKIFADCVATGIRKNHDYGSMRDVIAENGVRGVVIRMDDKQARLLSLTTPGHEAAVKDENTADTFRDMINYAAYGLMLLQGTWGVEPKPPTQIPVKDRKDVRDLKNWKAEFKPISKGARTTKATRRRASAKPSKK